MLESYIWGSQPLARAADCKVLAQLRNKLSDSFNDKFCSSKTYNLGLWNINGWWSMLSTSKLVSVMLINMVYPTAVWRSRLVQANQIGENKLLLQRWTEIGWQTGNRQDTLHLRIYLQQKVDLQMSFSLNKVSYFSIIIPQSSQRGKSIHLPPCGLGLNTNTAGAAQ